MKITVIGAGAVGGWFGGRLQDTGQDVTLVARGETLTHLQSTGLRLGEEEPRPMRAVGRLADAPPADLILLAIKVTGDATTALRSALDGIPDHAVVACTQNSVETPHIVADLLGPERVWPGVVRGFFHHVGPAHVEFHGGPISYNVGTFDASPASLLLTDVACALEAAGINTTVEEDIWVDVWSKAMFVGPFGALGAVTGQPLGVVRTQYRDSFRAMISEVAEVARAAGAQLPADAVDTTLSFADAMPEDSTSSMQRDIAAGRAHEGDAQVGAIVRMGQRCGVDTRLHDLIGTLIFAGNIR